MLRQPADNALVIQQTLSFLSVIQASRARVIIVNTPRQAGKTTLLRAWTSLEHTHRRYPINFDGKDVPFNVTSIQALKGLYSVAIDNAEYIKNSDRQTNIALVKALSRVPRLLMTTTTCRKLAPGWLRWMLKQPDTLLLRVERPEKDVPMIPGLPRLVYDVHMLGKWE